MPPRGRARVQESDPARAPATPAPSSLPGSTASSGTQTTAPLVNGRKTSLRTGSNDTLVNWAHRSPGPTPNSSRCQARKWASPLWLPNTPLGTPVLPDVKKTYAASSGTSDGSTMRSRSRARTGSLGLPWRRSTRVTGQGGQLLFPACPGRSVLDEEQMLDPTLAQEEPASGGPAGSDRPAGARHRSGARRSFRRPARGSGPRAPRRRPPARLPGRAACAPGRWRAPRAPDSSGRGPPGGRRAAPRARSAQDRKSSVTGPWRGSGRAMRGSGSSDRDSGVTRE